MIRVRVKLCRNGPDLRIPGLQEQMVSMKGLKPSLKIWKINTAGHIHTKLLCIFITGTQQPSDLKYIQKAVSLEVILSSFVCRCHLVSYCILHLDIFNCDFLEPLYILEYVWGVEKMCFCLSGWNEEMTHWWSVLTQCGQWKQIHLSSAKVLSRGRPEIAVWHHALKQPPLISYLNTARADHSWRPAAGIYRLKN